MNTIHKLGVLAMVAFLLSPAALADGHGEDVERGPSDAAIFGLCTAYGANETGREASSGAGTESEGEDEDGREGGVDASPAFTSLEDRARAQNQTTEEYCASQRAPGPPDGLPGAPDGTPGAPGDVPGAPDDTPGVPEDRPGAPEGTPTSPPSDEPGEPDDRPGPR